MDRRRGTVSVEMAVVIPVLLLLLATVIEIGLLVKDRQVIHQAARAGAWKAANGAPVTAVCEYVRGSAPDLDPDRLTIVCERRPYNRDSGTWDSWVPLGSIGSFNDAFEGDRVRVALDYSHQFAMGRFFGAIIGHPESASMAMSCAVVARRE